MAGYEEIQQEIDDAHNNGYIWVKPGDLITWRQPFCLQAIEQDSFNQNGKPQWTFSILYARQGQACERAFNLECNEYRDQRVAKMQRKLEQHGAMHHLLLIKKPNKSHPEWPFTDFADVPGKTNQDTCVCHGAGVIDPEDPTTWTAHYRMSQAINARLDGMGMEAMDTSNMDEKQLQLQMKLMGLEA